MIRPHPADWFEILVARDDAVLLLEDLARNRCIELEMAVGAPRETAADLQRALARFDVLAQRLSGYWPEARTVARPTEIHDMVARGMAALEAWSKAAAPLLESLQTLEAERSGLALWQGVLPQFADRGMDLAQLAIPGGGVEGALFIFPGESTPVLPPAVLGRRLQIGPEAGILATGPVAALAALTQQALSAQGRRVEIPAWLRGSVEESLAWVSARIAAVEGARASVRAELDAISARCRLDEALGLLRHGQWMMDSIGVPESGENFSRITGWTDDRKRLAATVAASDARALVHFPEPPGGVQAPLLLQNPWWARPFEVFSRALGMPARYAADPSMLLAVIVPLLFGYMFGDVGQGAVLIAAGLLLRKRVPVLGMLVAGGISAMLFGLLFGSVFGVEGLLPPLWVQPLEQPLPVLIAPLVGGAVLLLLGLIIHALEAYWRGKFRHWLVTDAGLILVYLGILTGFVDTAGYLVAALGAFFRIAGHLVITRRLKPALASAGELLEKTVQLLVNTISFVRVGAFALGHAGLSAAIIALAEGATTTAGQAIAMIAGNLVVIVVEAVVVSVQTTRLVLFEFFTRFFVSKGREYRPLPPPPFVRGEMHGSAT
jgi:V/A-type H+-transporting ATPase subunit I